MIEVYFIFQFLPFGLYGGAGVFQELKSVKLQGY